MVTSIIVGSHSRLCATSAGQFRRRRVLYKQKKGGHAHLETDTKVVSLLELRIKMYPGGSRSVVEENDPAD
jgi:hypothetical protein